MMLGLVRRLLPWSRRASFTHVVPLGLSCRVTYQLRRFFGNPTAYPFDWWISPLAGLARYLDELDPRRIYGDGGLREVADDGRIVALESVDFGVQPFHELPRHREDGVSVVSPGWRAHLPAAEARHTALLRRLLDLDQPGNRVLFVRHRFDADRTLAVEQTAVDALWHALCARFTRCAIHLALVDLAGARAPEPTRVSSVVLDDRPGPAPEEWRGDDRAWDAGFRSLGLVPLNAAPPAADAPWLVPSS